MSEGAPLMGKRDKVSSKETKECEGGYGQP